MRQIKFRAKTELKAKIQNATPETTVLSLRLHDYYTKQQATKLYNVLHKKNVKTMEDLQEFVMAQGGAFGMSKYLRGVGRVGAEILEDIVNLYNES